MDLQVYQFKKQQLSELTRAVTHLSSCLDLQEVSKTVTKAVGEVVACGCLRIGWME